MKRLFIVALIVVLLIGMISLTGCKKNETDVDTVTTSTSKNEGFDLKLDFKHMNNKVYNVHLNKNAGDAVEEYEEDEPNYVRFYNEKENYVLDLTLDTEAKDAYEKFQKSAQEDSDSYKEVKFGKYDGYYADDNGDIYGYILLDNSDDTFNAFICFDLYLDDEDKGDIQTTFDSSNIKNILNNIEFKVSE